MIKTIAYICIFLTFFACAQQEEEDTNKTIYVVCSQEDFAAGKCLRYMERSIFLAFASGGSPDKNNIFQKQTIKDAFNEVAENTDLGSGYFTFTEIDPVFIEPLSEVTQTGTAFKSFIQVYPDDEFNLFAEKWSFVPDQNAVVVINGANKRQFYMIIRASCFETNDINCTSDPSISMGETGAKALIARQLAQLVGAPYDCSLGNNNTMCSSSPSEGQWLVAEKNKYFSMFNSQLETIRLNPDVYDTFISDTNEAP
jgi:hypothetical protein